MTGAHRRRSTLGRWGALAVVACAAVVALWWQRERERPEALEAPRGVERAKVAADEALRGVSSDVGARATEVAAFEPPREPVAAATRTAVGEAQAPDLEPPRLVGRALDERGTPIARAALRVGLRRLDGSVGDEGPESMVRTDDEGRFVWTLEEPLDEPWVAHWRTRVERQEMVASFRVGPLASGERDVGDVRFTLHPLIVAGRVVDDVGRPVRARLEVWAWDEYVLTLSQILVRGITRSDGTFALRSQSPPSVSEGGQLQLRARSRGFADSTRTFDLGTDIGTWTLARLGELEGRLVLDPSWPEDVLAVRNQVIDCLDPGQFDSASWVDVAPDGTFRIDSLPYGTHDLWLDGHSWLGPGVPLWSAVNVGASEAVVLSEPWDVRPVVRTTAVTVLDPEGGVVQSLSFLVEATGGGGEWVGERYLAADPDGAFHFFHRPEGASVRLRPPGGVEMAIQCDGTSRTVTLRRAPRVEIRFLDHARLAADEGIAVTAMHYEALSANSNLRIDDNGVVRFEPSVAGTWEIHVIRSQGWLGYTGASAGVVEVVADVPVQSFELRLPEELFEASETDSEESR